MPPGCVTGVGPLPFGGVAPIYVPQNVLYGPKLSGAGQA